MLRKLLFQPSPIFLAASSSKKYHSELTKGPTLNGAALWRKRPPPSLAGPSAAPQLVNKTYYHSAKRRRLEPDDRTGTYNLNQVAMLQCPNCHRVRLVPPDRNQAFVSCCEIYEMKPLGTHGGQQTMQKAMNFHDQLLSTSRVWDFNKSRPRSNPHRPMNGMTSKQSKGRKNTKNRDSRRTNLF